MSDEQHEPHEQVQVAAPEQPKDDAWGVPLDSIPPACQDELRALADQQREWAAQDTPDLKQSAFSGVRLTGAEVFFLAAYVRAGPESTHNDITLAAERLRDPASWGADFDPPLLTKLHLEGFELSDAGNLSGASLTFANLTGADLSGADLSGANLDSAMLTAANLAGATLDGKTLLHSANLGAPRRPLWPSHNSMYTSAALGDIHWGGVGTVDLTSAEWGPVERLGDEQGVGWRARAWEHEAVVRAYRQLAAQLRAQGMSEVADRFAYRAQIRQRSVLLRRFRLPQYLGSWFLAILAGYGYRPGRTIF
jgi:hypothetical protein